MEIVDIHSFQTGWITTKRRCKNCHAAVGDRNDSVYLYCPECGHKYVRRKRHIRSDAVAKILEAHFRKEDK